jgi:tetratricopeptide (TPR) repeat protein
MVTAGEAASKGYQARKEGDYKAAREQYAEAARLCREEKDVLGYAHNIRHIADIYQHEHNPGLARPLYEEALAIYRDNLGTKVLDLANTVRPYALLLEKEGNAALAVDFWEEARNLYSSLRIDEGVSECNRHIVELQQAD